MLEQNKKIQELMEKVVGLRYPAVAVKMIREDSEIPEDAVRPLKDMGHHIALCQAFAFARRQRKVIYMELEDHWCWNPLIGYGQVECVPGQPQFDEVCTYIGIPDRQKAEAFFARFPRLDLL